MIAPMRRWAHAILNDGDNGYRDSDRYGDERTNHQSCISGYGGNRFSYRLSVHDHAVAVDVSRIVTLDRIVDVSDPGEVSGAGIVERDGRHEASQQDEGKDAGHPFRHRRAGGPSTWPMRASRSRPGVRIGDIRASSRFRAIESVPAR
jgi:hypothetical protein